MGARITGMVVAGRGLGARRTADSAVIERLSALAGCPLVPGTLNVRLPDALVRGRRPDICFRHRMERD